VLYCMMPPPSLAAPDGILFASSTRPGAGADVLAGPAANFSANCSAFVIFWILWSHATKRRRLEVHLTTTQRQSPLRLTRATCRRSRRRRRRPCPSSGPPLTRPRRGCSRQRGARGRCSEWRPCAVPWAVFSLIWELPRVPWEVQLPNRAALRMPGETGCLSVVRKVAEGL
jgi:hypothetical protein